MSKTPRTDANTFKILSGISNYREVTDSEFARDLERELAEAKAQLASRPEVVQISRDDLLRAIVQYMKMQRTDMNNSSTVKLACTDAANSRTEELK